ncbi:MULTISPECIES: hypothetical protein [Yersinia]|uniref:Hypothetical phage protein n=1 Tax=Yersinia enterocolitica serotype O:8 / biotype 1B (strain NCTC 13174 / 8081) TaxID=393305 RepID=K8FID2_YERE8|nr:MULTISPECIES: hypothetical protein [Yersinia]AJJ25036.1 putative transposase [Yersinia enterocolitica]EKN5909061.1 transposase [Yersinia enterocolitica]EKN6043755.1 transposase [Yersinia enterocolitica]EKN6161963.1 transposase [Yersinia enterocolitica]EKN6388760.1 transposase [Yersinia enterocolitica]
MVYLEELELIHESGDVLYPVKITSKLSGNTAFRLVPPGMEKKDNTIEVVDPSEVITLVIHKGHSVRCSTLVATVLGKDGKKIKRSGLYKIRERSITKYNIKK